ncbi:MAG TPA: hypothetical protein VFW97_17830 [Acidimicrobiia bacterium]|jgi:hypothetical protein|nr:hypothetical protein [Acidimicrobiia bacterium]
MNDETLQVFSGSAITPEELLVLAEFAAPSHFVSDEHLHDAADNLADWTDHRASTIHGALRLATRQQVRPSVVELLRAAADTCPGLQLARAS